MAQQNGGEDEEQFLRARLERLSGALDKRRNESAPRSGGESTGKVDSAMGLGLRAASELVAGIVVGGLIGWQLDVWLGTKPAFLIVFFILGFVAGVWNVIRATSSLSRRQPAKGGQADQPRTERNAPPEADENED